jgi:hypothetical protein
MIVIIVTVIMAVVASVAATIIASVVTSVVTSVVWISVSKINAENKRGIPVIIVRIVSPV